MRLFSGLPARVFGCVVFVRQNAGKLDPKALRCIFVGYFGTQKGYRSYHPPSRKFFVSADVAFNESTFYYQPATSPEAVPIEKEGTDLESLCLKEVISI